MVAEGPLTAAQIYEQITGGKGTQSLDIAQEAAGQLTTRMIERAQRINALRAKTMSGWQGRAGEAASDATLPLVQAAADDAVHLETARAAVSSQMDAFGTAKNSVKPVAPQPPELTAADVAHVLSGDGWGSYNTKVTSWQTDSQANIDAFTAYHSASSTNGGQMPAHYAQLTDSGSPISMADTKTSGTTDTGEWARNPRQPEVPAQQNRKTVQPGQSQVPSQHQNQTQNQTQNQPQNQFQNQFQQPGNTGSDTTHANSYVPQPVMPPAAQGGYQFGPTGQPISNLGGNNAYLPFGPGPGGGDFGPGAGGGYRPGGGTGTGTGYRPGAGAGAGTGTGGYGPGTGQGTRGPGGATGARLPEERMPTGPRGTTTGPRGANGMPMGAGPMGGRGGKEEDREKKKSPYLQNPDPDETFGGFPEKPMPPVIGETRTKK